MSRSRAFLAELKRRRVWRVAVLYAATAFVVVQMADPFFPRLALPDWSVTLVVLLALLGFPIALVLAWTFEMSPEGVRRPAPAPATWPSSPAAAVPCSVPPPAWRSWPPEAGGWPVS